MPESELEVVVNGRSVRRTVAHHRLLRDFIRDELGLTGTKGACDDGMCGSCSVQLDGDVVKSCLVLAMEADGLSITTVEGMAQEERLHPVQQILIDRFGFQCGYCTPGFVMTIDALARLHPGMDDADARRELVGNICRCTGYQRIVEAMVEAAAQSAAGSRVETGGSDSGGKPGG
jgi:carbon-monoxide dehydrogenase small subunit